MSRVGEKRLRDRQHYYFKPSVCPTLVVRESILVLLGPLCVKYRTYVSLPYPFLLFPSLLLILLFFTIYRDPRFLPCFSSFTSPFFLLGSFFILLFLSLFNTSLLFHYYFFSLFILSFLSTLLLSLSPFLPPSKWILWYFESICYSERVFVLLLLNLIILKFVHLI